MSYEVGQIIEHKALAELGRGRVDQATPERLFVTFERSGGGEQKTFVIPNDGIVLAKDQSKTGFDGAKVVKAAKARAVKGSKAKAPARTFDEAVRRFTEKYPKGFADPAYIREEREFKLAVQGRWIEQFGPDHVKTLLGTGDSQSVAKAFAYVYKGFNLLHTLEWIGFLNALKSGGNPRALTVAYANIIEEGSLSEAGFERLREAYAGIGSKELKWTVFTLWPFIACPSGFVFVKPLVTQAAATALGVELKYKAGPNYKTYQGCVEVYKALEIRLKPMGAKDWIDVQSFLWIGWKD